MEKATDNMHPADELHALREQKNELERRIKEARTLLLELARKVLLQRALRIAARAPYIEVAEPYTWVRRASGITHRPTGNRLIER